MTEIAKFSVDTPKFMRLAAEPSGENNDTSETDSRNQATTCLV